MNNRRQVAVAFVVVLATMTPLGVRLADPLDRRSEPPTVDPADPPERVAFDALAATRRGDYSVRWLVDDPDGGLPRRGSLYEFVRLRVEHSDGQMLQYDGASPRVAYFDENCAWVANATTGDRLGWICGGGLRRDVLVADPTPVLRPGADVTVVRENRSAMVLRINDTATALSVLTTNTVTRAEVGRSNLSAHAVLVVDKERGRLDRAELVQHPRVVDGYRVEGSRTVYRFTDWGTTEVRRPGWAGYSLMEFVVDVLDLAEGR